MKLIDAARRMFLRALACGLDVTGTGRGAELAGDVLELYAERRAARGVVYGLARAAADVSTLIVRPRIRVSAASTRAGRRVMARTSDLVRQALRSLGRRPLSSATIVATLALGLGLLSLTFTLIDGVLLEPLPFPRAGRLVALYTEFLPESGYVVATLGVYGVVAYGVARRTREFGMRMALGATRTGIAELLGRQMTTMPVGGLAVGLAAAAGITRFMGTLLFGVGPFDGRTYAGVAVVLTAAFALAVSIPARRAMSVDPVEALRAD